MEKSPSSPRVQSFYSRWGRPFSAERVSLAHQILMGIPSERMNLNVFIEKGKVTNKTVEPDCGTIACAVGWLSMNPEFQEMTGLLPGNISPSWPHGVYENGVHVLGYKGMEDMFAGAIAMATDEVRRDVPTRGAPMSGYLTSKLRDMGTLLFSNSGGSILDVEIRGYHELMRFFGTYGYDVHTDRGLACARLKMVYDHLSV